MSDSLRDALEKLVEQKSSEPDRRPRDKYGPIGRKAEPTIRVSMLRDMLAAHPVEPASCPTCNGRAWINGQWVATRETVGMVCQTCGHDYAAEPAGVSDEAVDAVASVLAEQFVKNPPANGSKNFRIDARAVLNILGGAK